MLGFTVLISLAAAIVTGLAPALSISRGDLAARLNEGSRGSTEGGGGKALRTTLVVAEVALSFLVLTGAGVLLRSFAKVESVDPGFEPHGVLAVHLSLPKNHYPHLADVTTFYDALLSRVQTLPGVSAAGVIQALPLSGAISSIPFTVVGRAFSKEEVPEAQYRIISRMYLKAMRIPLLAGREFNESDTDRTQLVCYVNETLAKRYWPGGTAVGARLMLDDNDSRPREAAIVGVIHNVKDRGLESSPSFDIYIPMRQTHEDAIVWLRNYQYWVLRTGVTPLALADAFRARVRTVDPDVAASDIRSMDQYFAVALGPRRFNLQVMSIFAAAALVLALAGIYGVISYSVTQKAHEIGIRMAVGAQRRDILRMVMEEGMRPVLVGLALGILGVLALTKEVASLLFAVSASDPVTLGCVTVFFGGASLVAFLVPARRATRVDPIDVLRTE